MADAPKKGASIETTVELAGNYEDIAELLGTNESEYDQLEVLQEDFESVLSIVTRLGGATKSQIVEELPSDVSSTFDVDTVIYVLRVLELYGLVELDGNTWYPGSALAD